MARRREYQMKKSVYPLTEDGNRMAQKLLSAMKGHNTRYCRLNFSVTSPNFANLKQIIICS